MGRTRITAAESRCVDRLEREGECMPHRETPDLETLGRVIRERRRELGLTQTQLAERLGWVQERVSTLENAKYGLPSLPALVRLSEELTLSLGTLLDAAGFAGAAAGITVEQPVPVALFYTLNRLLQIEAVDVSGVLNQASDIMAEAVGADKIDTFMYEAESASLVALGTSNTAMGRLEHQVGLDRIPLANGGRMVEVYETGMPFYTGHADQDPQVLRGLVQTLGVRSICSVPLRVDDKICGVLSAQSAEPDHFKLEERQFLEAAARWIGMVTRRAELVEHVTRAAAEEARRLAGEELVTLLAHDLGNYLTPLKGRLDVIQRRARRDERARDLTDVVEASRAVNRIQRLVSELLDVSRLDQGIFSLSMRPVDLVPLIGEVAATMRGTRENIDVRVPKELVVQADPSRMMQVLENLVGNAIQHSPDDLPIEIRAGVEDQANGQHAFIMISDEGPGIPTELLPTLFNRFAAGPRSSGLGLGLYLARSIIEAHGGTISVASKPGAGTSFRITLPPDAESRTYDAG